MLVTELQSIIVKQNLLARGKLVDAINEVAEFLINVKITFPVCVIFEDFAQGCCGLVNENK